MQLSNFQPYSKYLAFKNKKLTFTPFIACVCFIIMTFLFIQMMRTLGPVIISMLTLGQEITVVIITFGELYSFLMLIYSFTKASNNGKG